MKIILIASFMILLILVVLANHSEDNIYIYDDKNFKFTFCKNTREERVKEPKIFCHGPFCNADIDHPSKLMCDGKVMMEDTFDGTYLTENDFVSDMICKGNLGKYRDALILSYIICERTDGIMVSKKSCFIAFYPDFSWGTTEMPSIRINHPDIIRIPARIQAL